jgi:hypothetical protein
MSHGRVGTAAPPRTCQRWRHGQLVAYGVPMSLAESAFHDRCPRSIQVAMSYHDLTPLTRPCPWPTSRMLRTRSRRLPTTTRSVRFRGPRAAAADADIGAAPIRTPRTLLDFSPAPADRAGPAPDNTTPLRANRAPPASSRRPASDARQRNDCRPPPACA